MINQAVLYHPVESGGVTYQNDVAYYNPVWSGVYDGVPSTWTSVILSPMSGDVTIKDNTITIRSYRPIVMQKSGPKYIYSTLTFRDPVSVSYKHLSANQHLWYNTDNPLISMSVFECSRIYDLDNLQGSLVSSQDECFITFRNRLYLYDNGVGAPDNNFIDGTEGVNNNTPSTVIETGDGEGMCLIHNDKMLDYVRFPGSLHNF